MDVKFRWSIKGPGLSGELINREKIQTRFFTVLVQAALYYSRAGRFWNDSLIAVTGLEDQLRVNVERESSASLIVTCSFYNALDYRAEFIEQFLADSILEIHRLSWTKESQRSEWRSSEPSNYLEWLVSKLEDHSGGIERMSFELSSPHAHQRYELDRARILRLGSNLQQLISEWTAGKIPESAGDASSDHPIPLTALFGAIVENSPLLEDRSRTTRKDDSGHSPIHDLRSAIASGPDAFKDALHAVDYEVLSADEMTQVVRLAIEAGALSLARQLSARGASLHPYHGDLRKLERVLRVPEFSTVPKKGEASVRANNSWLRDHGADYRGEWVAIRNGELIAHGATAKEVKKLAGDLSNTLLTKIAA